MSVSQSTHYSLTHSTTPSQSTSPLTQTSPQSRVHAHTHTHPFTQHQHSSPVRSYPVIIIITLTHHHHHYHSQTPKHYQPSSETPITQPTEPERTSNFVSHTNTHYLTHTLYRTQSDITPTTDIATPHQPTHPVILTNHSHSLHAYTHTSIYQTSPSVAG